MHLPRGDTAAATSLADPLVGADGQGHRQQERQPADGKVGASAEQVALTAHGTFECEDDHQAETDADDQPAAQVGGQKRPRPRLREQEDDRRQQGRIERRLEREEEQLHAARVLRPAGATPSSDSDDALGDAG
jgi:hypothetical protein